MFTPWLTATPLNRSGIDERRRERVKTTKLVQKRTSKGIKGKVPEGGRKRRDHISEDQCSATAADEERHTS